MRFSVQTWFYLLTDKHTFCTWTHESSVLSWSGSNTVRLFKLMVNSLKTHQWCNDMDVCMELIMSTKLKETWHTKFLQELKCFSTDSYYLCVLQSLSRLCVSVRITKSVFVSDRLRSLFWLPLNGQLRYGFAPLFVIHQHPLAAFWVRHLTALLDSCLWGREVPALIT